MSLTVTMDIMSNSKMADMDMLCGRWILKQRDGLLGGPAPGTTFPPFSHNLPYYKEALSLSKSFSQDMRPECKCLSEPDLSHLDHPDSLESCNNHDEDYLFEFDIGSPASEVGSEESDSEMDREAVINVIEELDQRRFSVSSDSSSCSHRKDPRKESGISADGFSEIFGSISSGLGSERRSSQGEGLEEDGILEGLSVDPSLWKESCALYLGSNTTRAIETTSPLSLSPILSPDSCLEEESVLGYQDLCIECATEQSFQTPVNRGQPVQDSDHDDILEHKNRNAANLIVAQKPFESSIEDTKIIIEAGIDESKVTIDSETEVLAKLSIKETGTEAAIINQESEKIEINPTLHVTTEKLNALFKQLEADKFYPNQEDDDDINSPAPLELKDSVSDRPKLRKCSSLKTHRTPPGTPGSKKYVRFADILGLDLSEVKLFSDEIPRIPKTAFEDLDVNMSDFDVGSPMNKQLSQAPPSPPPTTSTSLVPMFGQPGSQPSFFRTVVDRKVCLENAYMNGPSTIFGVVRVLNISFHKSVTVRWTVNDWNTVTDTMCEYIQGSSTGNMDKFSFELCVGNLPVGSRLQFCLKFDCEGEYWDSNGGDNYVFQVFLNSSSSSRSIPSSKNFSLNSFQLSQSPSQHGSDPWMRYM